MKQRLDREGFPESRAADLRGRVPDGSMRKFWRAAEALPDYLELLQLDDLGPMFGSPLSVNVLREVRLPDGDRGVLKLIGEPVVGEALALSAWAKAGVACPPLLDFGVSQWSPGVTHLLLGWVSGEPMTHIDMPEATDGVCRLLASAHVQPPEELPTLTQVLSAGLEKAMRAWSEAGLELPRRVFSAAIEIPGPAVLLHGDPVGPNLLVREGRRVLLDPVGCAGPAEFDAGRWVARCLAVVHPSALPSLTQVALAADPTLRPEVLDRCIGLELVLEVGHRLENPSAFLSVGADPDTFAENTSLLIAAALERIS